MDDPADVIVNFLPSKTRRISPQGVSLFAIDYFDDRLGPLVAQRDNGSTSHNRLTWFFEIRDIPMALTR